jgi:HEAT repeat protein
MNSALLDFLSKHLESPHMRGVLSDTLIESLRDDSTQVRGSSAEALGEMGPATAEAISALITTLLKDDSSEVRSLAAEALGKIGPAAAEAVPSLIVALQDAESEVRGCAAEALGEIGPAAAEAVPALVARLRDVDRSVRRRVSGVLRRMRGDQEVGRRIHVELERSGRTLSVL